MGIRKLNALPAFAALQISRFGSLHSAGILNPKS